MTTKPLNDATKNNSKSPNGRLGCSLCNCLILRTAFKIQITGSKRLDRISCFVSTVVDVFVGNNLSSRLGDLSLLYLMKFKRKFSNLSIKILQAEGPLRC